MSLPRACVVGLLAVTVVTLAGCSSKSTAVPIPAAVASALATGSGTLATGTEAPDSDAGTSPTAARDTTGSSAARPAIDPCKALPVADVQAFFTVPIATTLPSALQSDTMKGCEWSAANGGGLGTALDVLVIVGQDGQDRWDLANETGKPEKLTGIGDGAEHLTGITDMWAVKGTGANTIWCGVTTTGWKELAGKKDLPDVTSIPDAAAGAIAGQYGLLCNRIFGSGNTTPTMTASAPTGAATVATATEPTVAAPAAGGVMPGTDIPIPQGMDCSGSHTAKDTVGDLVCTATFTDADAAYAFFLQALPTAGYNVNHKSYVKATNGQVLAAINFSGGKFDGFDFVNIHGTDVTITIPID